MCSQIAPAEGKILLKCSIQVLHEHVPPSEHLHPSLHHPDVPLHQDIPGAQVAGGQDCCQVVMSVLQGQQGQEGAGQG